MLGAGLRREFPGAFERAGRFRARLPLPARTGPGWAILAGIGVQALVGAGIGLVASAVLLAVNTRESPGFRPFELRESAQQLAGAAAGIAVALRAGGSRAALGLAMFSTATILADRAIAAPGRALFCERAGADFEFCARGGVIDELVTRWPLFAGLAAGLLLSRGARAARTGSNASLEAIGLAFVGGTIVGIAAASFSPPPADPALARFWTATSLMYLMAVFASGHFLTRRGAKPWPSAVVVAALFFLAPWLPTIAYTAGTPPPDAPAEHFWLTIAPAANALAFILASVVTAAFARLRPPGADAARRAAR